LEANQTNKLPLYQVGTFDDPIYGKTEAIITSQIQLPAGANPTFGVFSQLIEDNADDDNRAATIEENETIIEAILYIPYLTKEGITDSDGDGVDDFFDEDPNDPNSNSDDDDLTDSQEMAGGTDPLNADTDGDTIPDHEDDDTDISMVVKQVDIDSIYGSRENPLKLKVEQSTYFLRDLDPNSNFLEDQEYFSNQDIPSFASEVLFEGDIMISNKQILIQQGEDDPETEDVDESEQFSKIEPGIRVQLDSDFFQEHVLNQEGTSNVLSQANFNEFLRGIHISIESAEEGKNHYLLLDLRQATITLNYKYNSLNINGTPDDSSDDEVEIKESVFTMNLLRGEANGS